MRSAWEEDGFPDQEVGPSSAFEAPAECLTCGALLSGESESCEICGSPVSAERIVFGGQQPDLSVWFKEGVLETPKADLWRRLAAGAIDLTVVAVIIGLVYGPVAGLISNRAAFLLCALIVGVYFMVPYSTAGQTLGKSWLRIRVVSAAGGPLNWYQGFNRTLGYLVSAAPLALGFLWALLDRDRQAWHDKLASTVVVPAGSLFIPSLDRRSARLRERKWVVAIIAVTAVLAVMGYRFSFW